MGKLVDVFVNGKDYYVKKEESLIINNKIVYLYQTIFCEGELQLNNCDIIYSSGVLSKNPAIVAKTGSKVLISNCNIKETGVHKRSFLLAGYNFLLSKETTWKSNKIPAKLSKKNMELYHENKGEIKNAYGMLRNQPDNNDKVINNMDDIVISNCKFSNDKSLLGRLANVAHTGILKPYIVLECGGIVENCEFNIDLKCPYGIIRGTYNPRVYKEQNKLKDHVKRKGEITEVYYASG
ncbi:MAG: hypothetical protein K6G26_11580, partial [Lachnospiraceae bacterium]|nr:hypothetical protein [Lachnospiraceae bacterium]